jgi:hypothetical protein
MIITELAELGGLSPQGRSMTALPCVGRVALHNLLALCFPSTEPGILIPRARRPNCAYPPTPTASRARRRGPFWY